MNEKYELNPYTGDLEKIGPVYDFDKILKPVYEKIEDSVKNIKTITINLGNSNIKMNQIEKIVNKNKTDIGLINGSLDNINNEINNINNEVNNINNEINDIKQRLDNLENRMGTNESSSLNQNNEINLIKDKLQVLELEINKLKNKP